MPDPIFAKLPAALADHPRAALIEPVNIPAPPQFAADGEVETFAAVAFRHKLPAGLRKLPPEMQRGFLAYADLVERVAGASRPGPNMSGVRAAPRGVPDGPAAMLDAASRLRAANAALAGVVLKLKRRGMTAAQMRSRGLVPEIQVPGADLAQWLAIEGLSAVAILRRAGLARATRDDMAKLREAVLQVGAVLAKWS